MILRCLSLCNVKITIPVREHTVMPFTMSCKLKKNLYKLKSIGLDLKTNRSDIKIKPIRVMQTTTLTIKYLWIGCFSDKIYHIYGA